MINFKELIAQGIKCANCKSCREIQEDDYTVFVCSHFEDEAVDEEGFFCSEFTPKDVK